MARIELNLANKKTQNNLGQTRRYHTNMSSHGRTSAMPSMIFAT